MEWLEMITPELLVLVAFLAGTGMFLKNIPIFTNDWAIPLILWGLGIILSAVRLGSAAEGLVQGTFVAAVAVFGDQVYKQTAIKRKEE